MTSRNSFWASIRENNKRRIWLWLLSALGFIVAMPTAVALTISRGMTSTDRFYEIYGDALAAQKLREYLMGRVGEFLGFDSIMWFFVSAFAVVSAIQGFSYLYNRQKIDFYMGMPVKRSRRFLVIWLNGILVYLIPYLLGLMLSCLIAVLNGAMSGPLFMEISAVYGAHLCLYLGVYHLAILALMMTGNMIITCFGVAVFFLYELVIRMLVQAYMTLFFKFYSDYTYNPMPVFSPFAIYFRLADVMSGLGELEQKVLNPFMAVVYLLLFAAVVGVIAYACYLKRPAEAAGKAMAFSLPKPWLKILIAVPVTLVAGIVVGDVVGYRPTYDEGHVGYVFFSMAIVLVVTCCLIQVIYEFDIRGILHKKRHILISAVLTAMVFGIFKYDVFGYDSYIPRAEKVESVAFVAPMGGSYYGDGYFDEDMNTMSRYAYVNEYMYLTDVGTVNKLLKKSIDTIGAMDSLDEMYPEEETTARWYQVTVNYRMNNKRLISRKMYVNLADEETVELVDRIQSSEEFIAGAYIGASDILERAVSNEALKISAVYGSGVYEKKLAREEMEELLSLYREDIRKMGFINQRENIHSGSLVLNVEKQMDGYTMNRQAELRIYPFFDRCIAYLKEKGYYMENCVNPEDIERIQIINYNYEAAEQLAKLGEEAEEGGVMSPGELLYTQAHEEEVVLVEKEYGADEQNDTRKYATYEDTVSIEQIAEMIYPMGWIGENWNMNKERDDDYVITVYFKPGSEVAKGYGNVIEYCFVSGQVPAFVAEDTVYEMP